MRLRVPRRVADVTFNRRIAGIAAGTAAAIVLITWYVMSWVTSFPPTVMAGTTGGVDQRHLPDRRLLRAPAAPRLGLLPGQEPAGPVGAQHRRAGAGALAWSGSRSTTSTAPRGLRNPFLVPAARHGRRHRDDRRKAGRVDRPDSRVAHVRHPRPGRQRAAPGRRRRRAEPVLASRRARSRGAHHDHLHRSAPASPGHYRWQCFVPCAAGFPDRLRRPDADGRLDGRATCMSSEPTTTADATDPVPDVRRVVVVWLVLSAIGVLLVIFAARAAHAARPRHRRRPTSSTTPTSSSRPS